MIRTHVFRIGGLTVFAALTASMAWANPRRSPGDDGAESPALKAIQGTWVTPENNNLDAKWVIKGETWKPPSTAWSTWASSSLMRRPSPTRRSTSP